MVFRGEVPARKPIRMRGTPECGTLHVTPPLSEELIVEDGNVANAFVRIAKGLEAFVFAVPRDEAVLDQKGCIFRPHVLGLRVDQPLRVLNSDPVLHNVHAFPRINEGWNLAFPHSGTSEVMRIGKPETMIEYRCDLHGWMNGYIGVVDHPFFHVTGPDGSFRFEGVPAGTYTVEAWQESLGTRAANVVLGSGASEVLELELLRQ